MTINVDEKEQTTNNLTELRAIIELFSKPISVKNTFHKRVAVNKAYTEFTGLAEDTLLGEFQPLDIGETETKQCWDSDDRVIKTQTSNRHIQQLINQAGETRWIEVTKNYFKSDKGEEYIVSVLNDITALKQREAQLIEAERKSALKTKVRARSLADMGSDIKQPMDNILREARLLQNSDLNDKQTQSVERVLSSGTALIRILDDIIDFAKIDSGLIEIKREKFHLDKVINDLVMTLAPSARDKRLDLVVSMDPKLPEICYGDRYRLSQVLMNLIDNAVKFTEQGHVTLGVSGRTLGHITTFEFSVKDTGIGIPPEKINALFSHIETEEEVTSRDRGVSGLGLSLCHKLCKMMGGRIHANSTEGLGSEFTISIPLETEHVPKKAQTLESLLKAAYAPRHKILIVDDIEENYASINNHLSKLGHASDYAESANSAAKMLEIAAEMGTPYTLVFIDYIMPDKDGLLLTASLRNNDLHETTDIIVLSSTNDPEVRDCFLSQGITEYCLKPISKDKIEAILDSVSHDIVSEIHLPDRAALAR